MKKVFATLVAILALSSLQAFAQAPTADFYGATDIAAPVVQNRANLGDAVAGQIIFDSTSGAFFGLPVGGAPTTASSWVQLSQPTGSNSRPETQFRAESKLSLCA